MTVPKPENPGYITGESCPNFSDCRITAESISDINTLLCWSVSVKCRLSNIKYIMSNFKCPNVNNVIDINCYQCQMSIVQMAIVQMSNVINIKCQRSNVKCPNVTNVKCHQCQMLSMSNVFLVKCYQCKISSMWNVFNVKCSDVQKI